MAPVAPLGGKRGYTGSCGKDFALFGVWQCSWTDVSCVRVRGGDSTARSRALLRSVGRQQRRIRGTLYVLCCSLSVMLSVLYWHYTRLLLMLLLIY